MSFSFFLCILQLSVKKYRFMGVVFVVPLCCVWWAIAQVLRGQFDLPVITESAGWLQFYSSLPALLNVGVLSPGAVAQVSPGCAWSELRTHCLGLAPPSVGKATVSTVSVIVALPAVSIIHVFQLSMLIFLFFPF